MNDPAADSTTDPPPEIPNTVPQTPFTHRTRRRRTGKVAQLPVHLQHQINTLLEDGASYPAIIQALGPDGANLTPDNLSQWKYGGYQDWVQDQETHWLFDQTLHHAAELGRDLTPNQLLMRLLRVTAINVMHHLHRLDLDSEPGFMNPARLRLISLVPRVTRLVLEVHRATPSADFPKQHSRDHLTSPSAREPEEPQHDRAPSPEAVPNPAPPTTRGTPPSPIKCSAPLPGVDPLPFPGANTASPVATALVAEALLKLASSAPTGRQTTTNTRNARAKLGAMALTTSD